MDRNAPDYYVETDAAKSCQDTVNVIRYCEDLAGPKDPLVQPILTPRFAICCTSELLASIGELAQKYPDRVYWTLTGSAPADAYE